MADPGENLRAIWLHLPAQERSHHVLTCPDAKRAVVIPEYDEFTIRELAEKVIERTGSRSELVHNLLLSDEPRQRQPDITLAKEALGWGPKTNLNVGLDKTIAYFDAWLAKRKRLA